MNRQIQAILKISAKTGDMRGITNLQQQLSRVETKAKAFNRANSVAARTVSAAWASAGRVLGPIAAGYTLKKSFEEFANLERQLTRTGLKLGATRKDMDALKVDARATAQRYAVANAAIYETIDAYAETGAELRDIRADIDTIVKAQQAMGAEGRDVVGSWDAARKNFGLMSSEAEQFYDILAKGSATGKFEGSDLAKYLPSLLPIAGVQGLQGLSGTAQVVGALEAMRDRTGESGTAATAMTDFLDKLNSPDVQKNFRKLNIDLPKAMKEVRESGEDFFSGMSKILNRATRGDAAKLGMLFGERDSRNFARLLLQDIDDVEERIRVLREQSKGTIEINVKAITENAVASVDRLSNSWSSLLNTMGKVVDAAGASSVMDMVSGAIDERLSQTEYLERGMEQRGLSNKERMRLRWMGTAQERGLIMFEAGRRSKEGRLVDEYRAGEKSYFGSPDRGMGWATKVEPDQAASVPIVPSSRPDDFGFAGLPEVRYNRFVPPSTEGLEARDLADFMRNNPDFARRGRGDFSPATSDANYQDFQRAVSEGGNALEKSGQSAGGVLEKGAERAAEALVGAATAIAQAAAKLSNIKIELKQPLQRVRADIGLSGWDISARQDGSGLPDRRRGDYD